MVQRPVLSGISDRHPTVCGLSAAIVRQGTEAERPGRCDADDDAKEPTVSEANTVAPAECLLQHAVDGYERCPGESCPYWSGGRCQIDQLLRADVDTNPKLAGFLLDLRAQLMGGSGWRPFRRVGMPPRR